MSLVELAELELIAISLRGLLTLIDLTQLPSLIWIPLKTQCVHILLHLVPETHRTSYSVSLGGRHVTFVNGRNLLLSNMRFTSKISRPSMSPPYSHIISQFESCKSDLFTLIDPF